MSLKTLATTGAGVLVIAAAISGVALANSSGTQRDGIKEPGPVTAEEKVLLYRAEERLIRHCMADNGFEYHEIPPPADNAGPRDFPYVIDDVAWARKHGYGVVEEGRPTANPNTAQFEKLSAARKQAWQKMLVGEGARVSVTLPDGPRYSISGEGCIADARRALFGDLARWYRASKLTEDLPTLVQRAVRDDPRYDAAMADWAGCMRRQGHQVSTPVELRDEHFSRARTMKRVVARAAEIRTAVAEARCAQSTSLSRVIQTIEPEYERDVHAEFGDVVAELNAMERSALPVARDRLANP